MKKKALITILILNSIIILTIPEGHGGGIMILFEIIIIPELIENKINFLQNNFVLAILISLIGKMTLISSLIFKKIFNSKFGIKLGLILLLISFLSICYKAWFNEFFLFAITLGSGIPFLIYFGKILSLINSENKKT